MGEITEYLYPLGYALEINVEMESITIGGVALGFGMEVRASVRRSPLAARRSMLDARCSMLAAAAR